MQPPAGATHYTRIPNMVEDDRRLDAFAVRVYLHYRRRAGECGVYEAGTRETAEATGISRPIVLRSRAALAATGYIRIERRKGAGGRWGEAVLITDIWEANAARYQRSTSLPDVVKILTTSGQRDEPQAVNILTEAPPEGGERSTSLPDVVNILTTSGQRPRTAKKNPGKNLEPSSSGDMSPRKRGEKVLADAAFISELHAEYPTVNLERQQRRWLDDLEARAEANDPKRPPPKGNYKNAFRNWLDKAIAWGHESGPAPPASVNGHQRNGREEQHERPQPGTFAAYGRRAPPTAAET